MTTFSKSTLFSLLALSLAIVSCNKEKKEDTTGTDAVTAAETNAAPGPAPAMDPAPAATPMQAQPQATAPGMNPPHGQPGHRCEIPVGAPLNSPAPAKTQQQPQAQSPAPFMAAPAAKTAPATTTTAPGMNPPHGQPGHRCDVAVGAPLPK